MQENEMQKNEIDEKTTHEYSVEQQSIKDNTRKRKKKKLVLVLLVLIILIACDLRIKTVRYTFDSAKVKNPFKVALITDLHGNWYGKEQCNLIKAIDKGNPDVVLLGGDIFDDIIDYEESEETIAILSKKYKCYYVTGNHEYWSKDVDNIINIVKSYNITVLQGDVDTIDINGQMVNICLDMLMEMEKKCKLKKTLQFH